MNVRDTSSEQSIRARGETALCTRVVRLSMVAGVLVLIIATALLGAAAWRPHRADALAAGAVGGAGPDAVRVQLRLRFEEALLDNPVPVDLTGDGLVDLVGGGADDYVALLAGRGDGRFERPVRLLEGRDGESLEPMLAADLNADGRADLAGGASWIDDPDGTLTNSVWIALRQADGRFSRRYLRAIGRTVEISAVQALDFDRDGVADLATLETRRWSDGPMRIGLYRGDGTGGFTAVRALDVSGRPLGDLHPTMVARYENRAFAVADLNRDGNTDIVTSDRVFLGTGTQRFSVIRLARRVDGLALGDINSDGTPDLVVGVQDEFVGVGLGDGTGHFAPLRRRTAGAGSDPMVLDVNGDGHLDVLALGWSGLDAFAGDGRGNLRLPTVVPVGVSLVDGALAVADFDADGRTDVAWSPGFYSSSDNVALQVFTTGDASNAPAPRINVQPRRAHAGQRTCFRLRVHRHGAQRRTRVRFADVERRTDRTGRLRICRRLARGTWLAYAVAGHQGTRPASVRIR